VQLFFCSSVCHPCDPATPCLRAPADGIRNHPPITGNENPITGNYSPYMTLLSPCSPNPPLRTQVASNLAPLDPTAVCSHVLTSPMSSCAKITRVRSTGQPPGQHQCTTALDLCRANTARVDSLEMTMDHGGGGAKQERARVRQPAGAQQLRVGAAEAPPSRELSSEPSPAR